MRQDQIPDDLRPLAFEFFYWFSRLEFALKANRLLKSEKVGAPAEPGWNALVARFESNYAISETAKKLIDANPRRQVVGEYDLIFENVVFKEEPSDLRRVVTLLKTVRNNLFHGGKSAHDGWDSPPRMRELLDLTRPILDELAEIGGLAADYRGEY